MPAYSVQQYSIYFACSCTRTHVRINNTTGFLQTAVKNSGIHLRCSKTTCGTAKTGHFSPMCHNIMISYCCTSYVLRVECNTRTLYDACLRTAEFRYQGVQDAEVVYRYHTEYEVFDTPLLSPRVNGRKKKRS